MKLIRFSTQGEVPTFGVVVDKHALAFDTLQQRCGTAYPGLRNSRAYLEGLPASAALEKAHEVLAALQDQIPTYAAYPNLAWQSEGYSDLAGRSYSNYHPDGRQRLFAHAVANLT